MARRAASPIASSLARYGSGSRRGYSMRAMTSAASARPVPGAFDGRDERRDEVFLHASVAATHASPYTLRTDDPAPAASAPSGCPRPARRRSARGPDSCSSRRPAQPGALRRLEPPLRILDRDARRGSMSRPLVSRSRSNASRYGAGDGLLSGVSPAATIVANRSLTPAASMTSSISWRMRARRDRDRHRGSRLANELGRAGKQHRSRRSISCIRSPLRTTSAVTCSRSSRCRGPSPAPRTSRRRRSPDSARSTRPAIELDAFLGERLLKRLEVERLAVGDHAVEVEHDRLQRPAHAPGAFSPARIATFSRFDGGGYGHSYVAL